jgi:hypothetical protein
MSTVTQRKKKDKQTSPDNSNSKKNTQEVLAQEISKAVQAVNLARYRTLDLQNQWRAHLVRMSYLVVLLAMHQCSTPITECIKELKSIDKDDTMTINGGTFLGIIISDCVVELMSLIISIALFRFVSLKDPHGTFSSPSYCASSSMIIFCLGMFFHNYNQSKIMEDGNNGGCLANLSTWTGEDKFMSIGIGEEDATRTSRQFPVACAFHIIVTGCYFFMKMNMDQCDANVAAMAQLNEEFVQSKKGKKSSSTSSKSKKSD